LLVSPLQHCSQFGFDFEDSLLPASMFHPLLFPVMLPLEVLAVLGAYLLRSGTEAATHD
jgi:hypothetical protein